MACFICEDFVELYIFYDIYDFIYSDYKIVLFSVCSL